MIRRPPGPNRTDPPFPYPTLFRSGRFSKEQRARHDVVGAAQAAALAQARPGVPYEAGHQAVVETLTEGLLRLGLLKGKLEKNIADGSYKRFYLHTTGHWIGLAVHDVGDYRMAGPSRLLAPATVFTIAPGLMRTRVVAGSRVRV